MPRCHVHVRSGVSCVEVGEGSELPDLAAARTEALLDARSAMSRAILLGRDIAGRFRIEICDAHGLVLAIVFSSDAMLREESTTPPSP